MSPTFTPNPGLTTSGIEREGWERWGAIMNRVKAGEFPPDNDLWSMLRLYGVPPISEAGRYVARRITGEERPPRKLPPGARPRITTEELAGLWPEYQKVKAHLWRERRVIKSAGGTPTKIPPHLEAKAT